MNEQAENYNIYFSKSRADLAVSLMRDIYGVDAEHFNPHVICRVAEGEAFGTDLCVHRQVGEDMVIPPGCEDFEEAPPGWNPELFNQR